MVHVGAVRQTAQITWMSTEALRTGDKAIVNFKFVKTPEWIQAGRRFVFREGRTKAVPPTPFIIPPLIISSFRLVQ